MKDGRKYLWHDEDVHRMHKEFQRHQRRRERFFVIIAGVCILLCTVLIVLAYAADWTAAGSSSTTTWTTTGLSIGDTISVKVAARDALGRPGQESDDRATCPQETEDMVLINLGPFRLLRVTRKSLAGTETRRTRATPDADLTCVGFPSSSWIANEEWREAHISSTVQNGLGSDRGPNISLE
jgi:uncharacterized membrane protein (DUF485 family)